MILRRFRRSDRSEDRFCAGRGLRERDEAAIVKLERRRMSKLPGIKETTQSAIFHVGDIAIGDDLHRLLRFFLVAIEGAGRETSTR
jgi:hypothetical protein